MATMTLYNVDKSIQGVNGYGTLFSSTKYSSTLAAATEATVTVPGSTAPGSISATSSKNRYLAVFSYHAARNVWVALNATAAVPAGNTLVATNSELNPPAKVVKAGDVIHVICATATTDIGITFYALPDA